MSSPQDDLGQKTTDPSEEKAPTLKKEGKANKRLRLRGSDIQQPTLASTTPSKGVQFAEGPPAIHIIPGREHFVEGLECLYELDHLFLHQHLDQMAVFDSWATTERYDVLTAYGQRIFYAAEHTSGCGHLCTAHRPFQVNLLDSTGTSLIYIERKYSCGLICFPFCCGNKVEVSHGKTGEALGSCVQVCSGCRPTIHILDPQGKIVLIGKGDACGVCSRCCHNFLFNLYMPDGVTVVGKISKQEGGDLLEEGKHRVEPDSFGTSFPIELDSGIKTVLLAACFMIVSAPHILNMNTLRILTKNPDSLTSVPGPFILQCSESPGLNRAQQTIPVGYFYDHLALAS